MTIVEKVPAYGWPNCLRLANDHCELIATTDVGPRLIHFSRRGGLNLLGLDPALQGQTGAADWQSYGGHRLWHAPEVFPRSYAPDNGPVAVEERAGLVRLIQPTEPATGIQKELDLELAPDAARLRVTHRLRNHGAWPIELAPWALSVMAQNGTAILPLPPHAPHSPDHLQPAGQLTLWSYTNLADPRWTFGRRYLLARQDPGQADYQKLGLRTPMGWVAYVHGGSALVKTFPFNPSAHYPDAGTPLEVFINADILEVETLGPLTRLGPGASVEHTETWYLLADVPDPRSDADVEAHVAPRVAGLLAD